MFSALLTLCLYSANDITSKWLYMALLHTCTVFYVIIIFIIYNNKCVQLHSIEKAFIILTNKQCSNWTPCQLSSGCKKCIYDECIKEIKNKKLAFLCPIHIATLSINTKFIHIVHNMHMTFNYNTSRKW